MTFDVSDFESAVANAIVVDEIGMESARFRGFVLKTAYRPVFANDGQRLRIVMAMAETAVFAAGGQPLPAGFLDNVQPEMSPDERRFVAALAQTLHIGNQRNFAIPACDLLIDHRLGDNRGLLDRLLNARRYAKAIGEQEINADQIVCRLSNFDQRLPSRDATLAQDLRTSGFGLALDMFEQSAQPGEDERFNVDFAEIGASWFAKIAREPAAAKLLEQLVAGYQGHGIKVMIHGVATIAQLQVAIDCGADFLSGDLLSPCVLAGLVVDEEPISVARMLGPLREPVAVSSLLAL